MAYDAVTEGDLLLGSLYGLCAGRVYEEGQVDEEEIVTTPGNYTQINPYIVVSFGEPYDSADDRTIAGEQQQPMIFPFQIKCYGYNASVARGVAGAVRTTIRGLKLNENSSAIRLGGGGQFAPATNVGADTRYMRLVTGEMTINMQVDTSTP